VGALLVNAGLSAARASFPNRRSRLARVRLHGLTALLHLLQPLARLRGRLRHGLTPWRARGLHGLAVPWPRATATWCERWQEPQARLDALEAALRAAGAVVLHGGAYDRWDLQVRGGTLGMSRVLMAVEDHGAGTQFVRIRAWPRCSPNALALAVGLQGLSAAAALDYAWAASALLGVAGLLLLLRCAYECAASLAVVLRVVHETVARDGVTTRQPSQATDAIEATPALSQLAPLLQHVRGSRGGD
jgi:hypothetical protein